MGGKGPFYPLEEVKEKIRAGHYDVKPNAAASAWNDFKWKRPEIRECLLSLNDRYFNADKEQNHFYKQDKHLKMQNTIMDFYKVKNFKGESVFIHLYVRSSDGQVVISSFHELDT